jgi:GH15 family glucan-1,4-alpha-glucosidase
MAQPIENHGVVGNLRTAAPIGLDGAVNFLCWPRFDSPSIFASLLDDERGGAFELAPVLDGARHRQLYLRTPMFCLLASCHLTALPKFQTS